MNGDGAVGTMVMVEGNPKLQRRCTHALTHCTEKCGNECCNIDCASVYHNGTGTCNNVSGLGNLCLCDFDCL